MSHKKFILSPISEIINDVASASFGVFNGIETYPLWDYVMQSVLLRMTGAQEQKMKCICWEIATFDYEYRYQKFNNNQIGECSSYTDKNSIYKDIVEKIQKKSLTGIKIENIINRNEILQKTNHSMKDILSRSTISSWAQKNYYEYNDIWKNVTEKHFAANASNLLTPQSNLSAKNNPIKALKEIYEQHLYKQRNRIAHNTLSYQKNLPSLNILADDEYIYDNYFIYFSILILIDNTFINLYESYLQSLDNY